jgi:hypothetical protein
MNDMLIGAIAIAAFVAGLFFLRFWRATGDRFFLLFALSFWIEGGHRVLISQLAGSNEASPFYYLVRLVAYGLIIVAIVDKNRKGR